MQFLRDAGEQKPAGPSCRPLYGRQVSGKKENSAAQGRKIGPTCAHQKFVLCCPSVFFVFIVPPPSSPFLTCSDQDLGESTSVVDQQPHAVDLEAGLEVVDLDDDFVVGGVGSASDSSRLSRATLHPLQGHTSALGAFGSTSPSVISPASNVRQEDRRAEHGGFGTGKRESGFALSSPLHFFLSTLSFSLLSPCSGLK